MSLKSGAHVASWFVELPLTDPRCNNDSCTAFQAAHNASQAEVSYALQFEYGHWTTWYYLSLIGLFALRHSWRAVVQRRASRTEPNKPSQLDRLRATGRLVAYRRLHGPIYDRIGLPSLGLIALFAVTFALALATAFAVRPYYRGHRGYGSPPLGVRTGLMAVACTPLLVGLSGKANIITCLTGIGHEKLNVIHRFVGWLTFFLSVVHTIPFLVAPLNDGGPEALYKQFYKPGSFEYTGTPPLVILFGIVVLSIRWVRHRMYETFWHLHIVLALLYIALMFWHAGQELDSWAYLWATLAVLFASTLARVFYYTRPLNVRDEWFAASTAIIEKLPGDMTRITLVAPPNFAWRPGQHCYLRLPSIRPWDNHPFTIAASQLSSPEESCQKLSEMTFLIRSRDGFTRALDQFASETPDATAKVWLDGPYGGITDHPEQTYSEFILLAGGGGIAACLPWLQVLNRLIGNDSSSVWSVTLLWMVRHQAHIEWVHSELREILNGGNIGRIRIKIYVTREDEECNPNRSSVATDKRTTKEAISEPDEHFEVAFGRPNLAEAIPTCWTGNKTLVFGKFPTSTKREELILHSVWSGESEDRCLQRLCTRTEEGT